MSRTALRCTPLEERFTPADVNLLGKTLVVANPVGALTVETTAIPGQLHVFDSTTDGLFNGVGSLSVVGTAANNQIALLQTAATNKPFTTPIFVDSGAGNDTIQLQGRFTKGLLLASGAGDDTVTAFTSNVFIGRDLVWSDASGTNKFTTNNLGVRVVGALTLNGASRLEMDAAGTLDVGGALTIHAPTELTTNAAYLFNGTSTRLRKGLTVVGGPLNDVLNFTSKLTCAGNVTVDLRDGDNTFVLTPATPTPTSRTTVSQSLNYRGGAGVDVFVLGSNLTFKKDVVAEFGSGINTFVDTPTISYRHLSVTGGSSTDTAVVTGNVLGRLDIAMVGGDGDTVVLAGSIRSKQFRYTGSTGTLNVLTIAPAVAQTIVLEGYFVGNTTLTLGANLTLDGFGLGQGATLTFNPGTANLLPTLVLLGFA